ncbi:MAG: hypothetical protein E6I84_04470 [Chloroflexi bacterium]|nr:MAG: hypothetical protein E6I84_04470 [Chloroflexota bacterium]
MRFLFLTAIGQEVSHTLAEADGFEEVRQRISRLDPRLDAFVHCQLCIATWVGFILAATYRTNVLAAVDGRRPSAARRVANVAGDAVLITLATRWWQEVLALLRREVQPKRLRAVAEPAERIEFDRPMLPGISIRRSSRP